MLGADMSQELKELDRELCAEKKGRGAGGWEILRTQQQGSAVTWDVKAADVCIRSDLQNQAAWTETVSGPGRQRKP